MAPKIFVGTRAIFLPMESDPVLAKCWVARGGISEKCLTLETTNLFARSWAEEHFAPYPYFHECLWILEEDWVQECMWVEDIVGLTWYCLNDNAKMGLPQPPLVLSHQAEIALLHGLEHYTSVVEIEVEATKME